MIRFGVSTVEHQPRLTPAMSLHALCMHAVLHGLRVCRIPLVYVAPLPEASAAPLRDMIRHHGLRLVVHAPIVTPHHLEELFATIIEFYALLDATDAVIVCHLPSLSNADRAMFARLPAWVLRHLAIELTHQPTMQLLADIETYALPVIFDSLHYDAQFPWPYDPITALFACMDSWRDRTPLIHVSSQATALRHQRIAPQRGTHSDVLDTTHTLWLIRSILDAERSADIEIEAPGGLIAYHQLREAMGRVIPARMYATQIHPKGSTYAESHHH